MKRLLALVMLLGTSSLYSIDLSQATAFADFLALGEQLPKVSSDFSSATKQFLAKKAKFNYSNPGPWAKAQLQRMSILLQPVKNHILSTQGILIQSIKIGSKMGIKQAADLYSKLNSLFSELQDTLQVIDQAQDLIK